MANLLLIISFSANAYFFLRPNSSQLYLEHKTSDALDLYDLNQFYSVYNYDTTIKRRFDNLYKTYMKDKESPDESYYSKGDGKIDPWWQHNCLSNLKKIVVMRTRIRDIEHCIIIFTEKESAVADMIKEKRYEELLADMSNYYSRFVSVESYNSILHSMD